MFYQRIRFPGHKLLIASYIKNDAAIRFGNRTAIDILLHFKNNHGPKVVVDVGGNVGTTSIVLGVAFRNDIKIYVAEPNPKCFEALLENIKMYNLENVVFPFNVAIGSGLNFMRYSSLGRNSGTSKTCSVGGRSCFKIKSMSLDDFICNIGSVDVLKMDVEGAEYKIFSEFTLWHMVKSYHVEFHDFPGIDRPVVENIIKSKILKYSTFVEEVPKLPRGSLIK